MAPCISVIVPFHNVDAFLPACLDSLAAQTVGDLEVIMVDDGSTDGSAVIAKSYEQQDPRFRLLQQDNQGPGPARNAGIAVACGEYLAFADGDDTVARFAYEHLIGSLERTGSDFACGGVRRMNSLRSLPSPLHEMPFSTDALATHVVRKPELLRDRTVWNKVWRRSFWDRHGLQFSTGIYEDVPVALKAHVLATTVDVHAATVYFWRVRDGGMRSITQRRRDLGNIHARFAALAEVRGFLLVHAPQLLHAFDAVTLDIDLALALDAVPQPHGDQVLELLKEVLEPVAPAVLEELPALTRLQCHLIKHGMQSRLVDTLNVRPGDIPVVRAGGLRRRWYADYPFRDDPAVGAPAELYDVTNELELKTHVDDIRWEGSTLMIEGHAQIDRIDMERGSTIRAWLKHQRLGLRIPVPIRRVPRPDVTADSGQSAACYDHSGFRIELQVERLQMFRWWWRGNWEVHLSVRSRGLRRSGRLRGASTGRATWTPYRSLPGDMRIQAVHDGGLAVRVKPIKAMVTSYSVTDGTVEFRGWFEGQATGKPKLRVSRRQGAAKIEVPLEISAAADRSSFVARLSLERLAADQAQVPTKVLAGEGIQWTVELVTGPGRRPVGPCLDEGVRQSAHQVGGREIVVTQTRYGGLTLVERSCRLTVGAVSWNEQGALVFSGGRPSDGSMPPELVLRCTSENEEHRFPVQWTDSGFVAEVSPGRARGLLGPVPLLPGTWNLTAGETGRPVSAERGLLTDLPASRTINGRTVSLSHNADALFLKVRVDRPDEERGAYAQRRLREHDYPVFLQRRITDRILFESWSGSRQAGDPRAIYEELRQRDAGCELIWVDLDRRLPELSGGQKVLKWSREYYELLATARAVVTDRALPRWYQTRPDQTYLQTWHGIPMKSVGFETAVTAQEEAHMAADTANWSLLLSPGPLVSSVMRRAFQYRGEILESGSPRNDILFRKDRADMAADVRRRLGLPADRRTVLYAPTWREEECFGGSRSLELKIDLDRARDALGADHMFLIRGHEISGGLRPSRRDDFVMDVTHYPEIAELYLVADVLVTDYSSAMFDFLHTGRPMIFFAYDLADYRQSRGFSFEFDPPGPVVQTSEELFAEIDASRGLSADYRDYISRFCPIDDGQAAHRVADRLLHEL